MTNRETTWTQGEREKIAKSSHSSSPTFGSTTLTLSADCSQDPWHKAKVHLWSLDETGTKTASGHLFKGNVAPFATASTTSPPQQFHGLNDQCLRSTGNAVHLKKKQTAGANVGPNCEDLCDTATCFPNAQCFVQNNRPMCRCLPGFQLLPVQRACIGKLFFSLYGYLKK